MKTESRSALLRPELERIRPYHVPVSDGMLKLDAMENPYGWPAECLDEWVKVLREAKPNRYPDPASRALKQSLRKADRIPDSAELLLGNGSDEVIQILLMALRPGSVVLAPEPTFVMYRQIAESLGLSFVGVPLESDRFCLDLSATLSAIEHHNPALIFLAYPNNPTGNLFPRAKIDAVLSAAPGLVVVDEAYAPFAGDSYMDSLRENPRLLVMRTLSKLGLAGLRLGYLSGAPHWLSEFEKLRLPYNIGCLTQLTAGFALDHPDMLQAQVNAIVSERERVMTELGAIHGVTLYDSAANFVLIRLPFGQATSVFEGLKAAGILIKNLHPQGGLLTECLRITIGTPDENARLLSEFRRLTG